MRGRELLRVLGLVLLVMIIFGGGCYGADEGDISDFSKLSISVAKPSETLDTAIEWIGKTLATVKPLRDEKPTAFTTANWGYVLYGNLFNTHEDYALMEVPQIVSPGYNYADYYVHFVALARWTNGKWKLSGLWDIDSVWRPKGWKPPVSTDNTVPPDSLSIDDPAEHPFELENFGGFFPAIVIAGDALKYCQVFYLFQFDPKSKSLIAVGQGTKKPTYIDGYVCLYDNPTRHGTWTGTSFFKFSGVNLVEKASYFAYNPNNENGDYYHEISVLNDRGRLMTYRLRYVSGFKGGEVYKITRDDKQIARVTFLLRDSTNAMDYFDDSIEEKYLFEKITGLPGTFYPIGPELLHLDMSSIKSVTVTGESDMVKALSFKR